MNLPEDNYLTYIVEHEAWYTRDGKRGLDICASILGGGISWELKVTEHLLAYKPAIRLEVFGDAFAALAQVPGLFARLAELEDRTLEGVITILDDLGAEDKTPRRSPYALALAAPGEELAFPFVVQYDDGSLAAKSASEVSYMHDMADCDGMEEVRAIYATDEKGQLVPIQVGPQARDEGFPEDSPVYYASAPVFAGQRLISHVHFSGH